jgi:hypothetical protein
VFYSVCVRRGRGLEKHTDVLINIYSIARVFYSGFGFFIFNLISKTNFKSKIKHISTIIFLE